VSQSASRVDDLSIVVQDYLKAIWTATEWGGEPITTTGLAKRFGTSNATVSEAMHRLADAGLVAYQPYKPVSLTAAGVTYATQMVRRHRLLETFLAEVLGYPWDAVHDEAERLEHAASDAFIERIDAYLGHPERDPHGDPINPATTTGTTETLAASRLDVAPPGSYRVLRVSDANPEALTTLETLGLTPGSHIRIIKTDPATATITLQTPTGPQQIPLDLATNVWLQPILT
jgi:DtxR family Mn-dependent transcriptional regulator